VKYWAFQITKDLDRAQKLIEIVREAPLRVALGTVREDLDLWLLTLRFRWQTSIHGHVSVPHEVTDSRHDENDDKHPVMISNASIVEQMSYKVVKFIVKVKLIEKSVNSHAGNVYVIQYKMVGSTLKTERMTRPSKPEVVDGVVSAGFIPRIEDDSASAVLYTAAFETSASDRDVTVPGAAMVAIVVNDYRDRIQTVTRISKAASLAR
jgi:hypothetical protein